MVRVGLKGYSRSFGLGGRIWVGVVVLSFGSWTEGCR